MAGHRPDRPSYRPIIAGAMRGGDRGAMDRLLPLVYDQLRLLAHRQLRRQRAGETLNTTALAHEAYLNQHSANVMARGPLLDDAGTNSVGSIWLLDVPDLEAGRALLESDPFYKSGIYKDVMFHRWRFGRVFDRSKV